MDKDIIFFDLETTGVDITKDRIVSLSTVKTTFDYKIIEKKEVLFNPTIPIPKEASEVHKITDEMVKDQPTFLQRSKGVFSYFNGAVLAGYNIKKFDIPLLVEEFLRCGLDLKIEGVIDCYEIAFREKRDLTWALKFYAGETMENAHNSSADTEATVKILDGQIFMYDLKKEEIFSKYDTLDFSGKITNDGKYTFGKHKDKEVLLNSDTIDFAFWMLKPSQSFTLNTKNVIKSLLKTKGYKFD